MFSNQTAASLATLIVFFSLAVSSTPAHAADFSGSWQGSSGTVQLFIDGVDQGTAPCHAFDFNWEQSSFELKLVRGYWHCGYQLIHDVSEQVYEIRGSELWLWGESAGTLTEDSIELLNARDGQQSFTSFQLVNSATIIFTSSWSDGFSKFIVRGTLSRTN
ncbi:MAG: hypothetical protein A2X94_03455 [Bdellovibrionales bacterium GWB1_55_8]|nr:MAG: hypothetical protein A2X94_03455 [Bdellovibrionales bacterium GWB1_55_8]